MEAAAAARASGERTRRTDRLRARAATTTSGETLTGGCWVQPTRMKYENWGNQQMYESKEESSFCCRCLCRGHRSFRMPIL